MKSQLFRIYLHAITSSCMTDSLTDRTGTEEALSSLRSASTKSFMELSESEIALLLKIRALTPLREYRPKKDTGDIQRVHWNELPSLSQHGSFYRLAMDIIDIGISREVFGQKMDHELIKPTELSSFLRRRAAQRDSTYYAPEFKEPSIPEDTVYRNRHDPSQGQEHAVRTVCTLVDHWTPQLNVSKNLLGEMESWNQPIQGMSANSAPLFTDKTLVYDRKWLMPIKILMPENCVGLVRYMSAAKRNSSTYPVMFLLATLTYNSHNPDTKLAATLLAFATVPNLILLGSRHPRCREYQLNYGYTPSKAKLLQFVVQPNTRGFSHLAREWNIPQEPNESVYYYRKRRKEVSTRRPADIKKHMCKLCWKYILRASLSRLAAFIQELIAIWMWTAFSGTQCSGCSAGTGTLS